MRAICNMCQFYFIYVYDFCFRIANLEFDIVSVHDFENFVRSAVITVKFSFSRFLDEEY